jgi:Fe-S cluster biogenesis protein NfuA
MAVFRDKGSRAQAVLEQGIARAIAELEPLLHTRAGGVAIVELRASEGLLLLRVDGECPGCDMKAETLQRGIEAHIRQRVPGIREVRVVPKAGPSH